MRREIEILCLVFLGYVCLMLGLRMGDIGFQVFFYILAGGAAISLVVVMLTLKEPEGAFDERLYVPEPGADSEEVAT